MSGTVSACASTLSTARSSSMPAVMFPHWSLPPICSVHPRACTAAESRTPAGACTRIRCMKCRRLHAGAHRFFLQHVVHAEVLPHVAHEIHGPHVQQPVGVVAHDRAARLAERQKAARAAPESRAAFAARSPECSAAARSYFRTDRRSWPCRRRPARSAWCPARCRCASPITGTRFPTCRLAAVGSKPQYAVTGARAQRGVRAPRCADTAARARSARPAANSCWPSHKHR